MFKVYVVTLAESVWGCSKFVNRNPDALRCRAPVYVGSTGMEVDDRIARHKAGGLGGNNIVKEYHEDHGVMGEFDTREEAECYEQHLAKEFRRAGTAVWCNNKKRR